jgi:hypothetical protein
MTEILQKLVVNCETGVAEYLPLTEEEIAQRESDAQAWAAEVAAREAEAIAKAEATASLNAKLEALGLSPEEIAALRG